MKRRYFVSYILGGLSFPVITNLTLRPKADDYVMTVSGKIQSNKLGLVLPHEHIMSNFGAQAE